MLNEKVYDNAYAFRPTTDLFKDCIPAKDVLNGTHVNE